MTPLTITHATPDGTVAYSAELYFDDGDFPNAQCEHLGYFTTAEAAVAVRDKALAAKDPDHSSAVQEGATAGWCGVVERCTFYRDPEDEWFVQPTAERDYDWPENVTYRGDDAKATTT
jgi:hypothetical protein